MKFFTLVTKFPAKNEESTPLKNYASCRQTASHQDKKEVSSEAKPLNRKPKRKKNKSSTLPSGPKSAKQHSVRDSSNVKAEQPKFKKKLPAVVARDRARRKEYWKRMKVSRQLRATDRSKAVLLLWIFYVFVLSCVCYVLCTSVYLCFVVTCWERADLLALVCGVFCEFVTFPLVSWVRCGT